MPASAVPPHSTVLPVPSTGQFAAHRKPIAEPEHVHQWLPGEEEFSKAALIAQADEEEAVAEAIFEELDRLERVHGPEQADDIPNNTVIEFSEVEL